MRSIAFLILFLNAGILTANPVVRGTWFGYIMNYGQKLPATLYITDDNDAGQIYGTITISFPYQSGKFYNCEAKVSGYVDYKTYSFSMVMEEYIYYDLLPEGMKWCLGTFYGNINREMELKKYIMLGNFNTKCTETESKVVLVKQQ